MAKEIASALSKPSASLRSIDHVPFSVTVILVLAVVPSPSSAIAVLVWASVGLPSAVWVNSRWPYWATVTGLVTWAWISATVPTGARRSPIAETSSACFR